MHQGFTFCSTLEIILITIINEILKIYPEDSAYKYSLYL
jgi:hypothetical protein